jgi:hypothetical protein
MAHYKHKTKEIYVSDIYLKMFGYYVLQWEVDHELRQKEVVDPDITNFDPITFEEWQHWRIHEVWYDGQTKSPGIHLAP